MRPNLHRIGIDLGGTKIAGIALNPEGVLCAEARIPTPRDDYPATLAAVSGLVDELEKQAGVQHGHGWVGIGMPGALSVKTGLVKNANSTWLNGKPFDKDIAAALKRPVRLANDANCLAVSEATDGAGAGQHVVFGVILGTGCGGGIAIDGVPVTGLNAMAKAGGISRPALLLRQAGLYREVAVRPGYRRGPYGRDRRSARRRRDRRYG
jgi:fructokinase